MGGKVVLGTMPDWASGGIVGERKICKRIFRGHFRLRSIRNKARRINMFRSRIQE